MAIPDFQSVILPLVKILGDGQERTMREVTHLLAESFHLTDQEGGTAPQRAAEHLQQPGGVGKVASESGGAA